MVIPTEPIGSIPRPRSLIEAVSKTDSDDPKLDPLYDEAIRDTIARFEATGSPVITDGEQRKYHNFRTYCVHGLPGYPVTIGEFFGGLTRFSAASLIVIMLGAIGLVHGQHGFFLGHSPTDTLATVGFEYNLALIGL